MSIKKLIFISKMNMNPLEKSLVLGAIELFVK